jgi:histidinol phosphatase-like enzyme (inositol monophosphatase family)
MTDPAALDHLAVAHALADVARGPALRHFRSPDLPTSNKAARGYDPVTEADREVESAMRARLAELRPDDGVLGEEHGRLEGVSGMTWVLDPIDGTRAFVIGAPTWGVLIALNDGTRPVAGVIDQPYVGERFWGDGVTAWTRRFDEPPRSLTTRRGALIEEARLCSTYPEIGDGDEQWRFSAVRDRVRLTRYGLDCMAYAFLAAGHVDLVIEAGLQPYDVQALIPVIEGAGGVVTDWEGRDPQHGGRVLAAADSALHEAALKLLGA